MFILELVVDSNIIRRLMENDMNAEINDILNCKKLHITFLSMLELIVSCDSQEYYDKLRLLIVDYNFTLLTDKKTNSNQSIPTNFCGIKTKLIDDSIPYLSERLAMITYFSIFFILKILNVKKSSAATKSIQTILEKKCTDNIDMLSEQFEKIMKVCYEANEKAKIITKSIMPTVVLNTFTLHSNYLNEKLVEESRIYDLLFEEIKEDFQFSDSIKSEMDNVRAIITNEEIDLKTMISSTIHFSKEQDIKLTKIMNYEIYNFISSKNSFDYNDTVDLLNFVIANKNDGYSYFTNDNKSIKKVKKIFEDEFDSLFDLVTIKI